MRDRETGRSRGLGFITFYNLADAEAAAIGLNGQALDGATSITANVVPDSVSGGLLPCHVICTLCH